MLAQQKPTAERFLSNGSVRVAGFVQRVLRGANGTAADGDGTFTVDDHAGLGRLRREHQVLNNVVDNDW